MTRFRGIDPGVRGAHVRFAVDPIPSGSPHQAPTEPRTTPKPARRKSTRARKKPIPPTTPDAPTSTTQARSAPKRRRKTTKGDDQQ